jgi:hypothetical protein
MNTTTYNNLDALDTKNLHILMYNRIGHNKNTIILMVYICGQMASRVSRYPVSSVNINSNS